MNEQIPPDRNSHLLTQLLGLVSQMLPEQYPPDDTELVDIDFVTDVINTTQDQYIGRDTTLVRLYKLPDQIRDSLETTNMGSFDDTCAQYLAHIVSTLAGEIIRVSNIARVARDGECIQVCDVRKGIHLMQNLSNNNTIK